MTDFWDLPCLPREFYSTAYMPIVRTGNREAGIKPRTYRVAAADLVEASSKVEALLASAALTAVEGMPVLPPGVAARRLSGFVTATDASTGDACSWDIQALATRNPVTGFPRLIGPAQVSVFQSDDSMTALGQPIVAPAISGLNVSLAGLQGRQFVVSGVFFWA